MMRSRGLVALLAAVVGCHRAPPPAPEKQPDPVSAIPATGPLVILESGQIGEDRAAVIAPWLVDPETGVTHRLAELDASCEGALRYVTSDDGSRHLYSFDPIRGWSQKRQTFFVEPTTRADAPLVALTLDGKCAAAWQEPYASATYAISGDGATIARKRDGVVQLLAPNGTSPRTLAWTSGLTTLDVALSPTADRIAILKSATSSTDDLVVCDLAGTCTVLFPSVGTCNDLQWSQDGARVGCITAQRNGDNDAITIADVAHPGAAFVLAHVVKRTRYAHPGHITHFGFSPDGLRVAFVSSHEAGCTPYVRDLGSTCPEVLYVASAEHPGPLRPVRSGLQNSGRPWWIR